MMNDDIQPFADEFEDDREFMHEFDDTYNDLDVDDGQPSMYEEYQDLYGGDDNPMDFTEYL